MKNDAKKYGKFSMNLILNNKYAMARNFLYKKKKKKISKNSVYTIIQLIYKQIIINTELF